MCAGVVGTQERAGACWRHLPSWGRLGGCPATCQQPLWFCAGLVRYPATRCTAGVPCIFHCDVHKDGHVHRAPCSVPCPPPTVPIVFYACMPTRWLAALSRSASLKHVTHWSLFRPDFSSSRSRWGFLGIPSQRTYVRVVFGCAGVSASSTRALDVSAVPLEDLQHGFFF